MPQRSVCPVCQWSPAPRSPSWYWSLYHSTSLSFTIRRPLEPSYSPKWSS